MFAESPFLQIVEHVFIFSVVLDFLFSTMVHRTIKLAWYHVYKLVKTHLQDARLGCSHQEIALKEKIQIPYRNLETSRPSLAGHTRTNKLPPKNSQFPRQPSGEHTRETGREWDLLTECWCCDFPTAPKCSRICPNTRLFLNLHVPLGRRDVFEQNDWLSQNCLAFFKHHT